MEKLRIWKIYGSSNKAVTPGKVGTHINFYPNDKLIFFNNLWKNIGFEKFKGG